MSDTQPRLYDEFASWYHLLTHPDDYAEESEFYLGVITDALGALPSSLLELGSGGGNMASHYKQHVPTVVLSDLSPGMVALSQTINPECEHHVSDMRTLRLDREFDAVFIHDAIVYLLTEDDLRQAITTAWVHLCPGGVAVFAPDHIRESFQPNTDCGGHDGDRRALRYLEWTTDPDPSDHLYTVDYAYILHEDGKPPRIEHDRHIEAAFPRATWLALLQAAGFQAHSRPMETSDEPAYALSEVFVASKPLAPA